MDVELGKHGWELQAPGSGGMFVCTVGGSVAYNSVPHGLAGYGMTGDGVVALEVVLPNGEVMWTGSAANRGGEGVAFERYANGPDMSGLFIGSCGVFGVITRVSYKIRRKPEYRAICLLLLRQPRRRGGCRSGAAAPRAFPRTWWGSLAAPSRRASPARPFLHLVIRDGAAAAAERLAAAHAICGGLNGVRQDESVTERYWVHHMYSWLRNTAPEAYYSDRPYTCPEAAAFLPTANVKDAIQYLKGYEVEHAEEFARHGIRIKCYDVYFSRNAAFLWIDTLYPELDAEAWKYGLKMRADYSEYLFSHYASPGGILAPLAEHIMPKLGAGFGLMRTLKKAMDPNGILNPGVLMLGDDHE